jgi:hypothetical protein
MLRRLEYDVVEHLFLLALLSLQWLASSLLLFFAVPMHLAYLLTQPRAKVSTREAYFITGASSGIGAELAVKLAARRETVGLHLVGRDDVRLEATRRACRAVAVDTLRIYTVTANVADAARMVRALLSLTDFWVLKDIDIMCPECSLT